MSASTFRPTASAHQVAKSAGRVAPRPVFSGLKNVSSLPKALIGRTHISRTLREVVNAAVGAPGENAGPSRVET